jgi:hypothetical protein
MATQVLRLQVRQLIQRHSAAGVGDLITVSKGAWRDIRDDRDSLLTALNVSRAADDISAAIEYAEWFARIVPNDPNLARLLEDL